MAGTGTQDFANKIDFGGTGVYFPVLLNLSFLLNMFAHHVEICFLFFLCLRTPCLGFVVTSLCISWFPHSCVARALLLCAVPCRSFVLCTSCCPKGYQQPRSPALTPVGRAGVSHHRELWRRITSYGRHNSPVVTGRSVSVSILAQVLGRRIIDLPTHPLLITTSVVESLLPHASHFGGSA